MNTRLQVEHPVTEMITGKDLVREQILVARNEPLSFTQEELSINGHAMEIRVYAEDPENNFLPDIGKLQVYRLPQGNGVRVDGGFEEGMDIPIYYDPMLSKLIVYGADRKASIAGMIRAIDDYQISGVKNTLAFCRFVMEHDAFVSGNFDTNFVRDHYQPAMLASKPSDEEVEIAALLAAFLRNNEVTAVAPTEELAVASVSKWKQNRGSLH
jgi:propionyl-CoA carboxylase alpha chain